MSFSGDIKEELSKMNNLKKKEEVLYELSGYLSSKNALIKEKELKFSTENEYNINRFSKLLTNVNIDKFKIQLNRKIYTISVKAKDMALDLDGLSKIDVESLSVENAKAYIRGCFLGGGSITNPNTNYHLDIILSDKQKADNVLEILKRHNIQVKKLKDTNVIYIKDGEEISQFLAFIGASRNVIKYEEIRVVRDMKNNVNRLVNCETANMNKTIDASVEQISYIKKIKKAKKFNDLDSDLKELATLREKNPNATLEELGKMMSKPLSKASVSNKFKKIKMISEKYR